MLSLIKLSLLRHCSVFLYCCCCCCVDDSSGDSKNARHHLMSGDRCLYVPVRHCQRYQLVVKLLLLLASNHGFSQ